MDSKVSFPDPPSYFKLFTNDTLVKPPDKKLLTDFPSYNSFGINYNVN